jgi:ABC-type nitrate/sulfonate/bicarbonate transport system ATPase subunit
MVTDPIDHAISSRLRFHGIRQWFGDLEVLRDVGFTVERGEFVAVLGPSGCGKSTLIQMAAGLMTPTGGDVVFNGHRVDRVNAGIGLVPQQAQLLPWKTLLDNVALPLELRGVRPQQRLERAREALKAVDLSGFEAHYPHQLSGGMQKRGSIARAMIYRPDVLLMDEPFGALDSQTRMILQTDLQTLVADLGASVLLVTHDIAEAVLLADTVVVLSRRPTRVLARIVIDLPRPRNLFQPMVNAGFADAYDAVFAHVRGELGRADA